MKHLADFFEELVERRPLGDELGERQKRPQRLEITLDGLIDAWVLDFESELAAVLLEGGRVHLPQRRRSRGLMLELDCGELLGRELAFEDFLDLRPCQRRR